MKEFILRSVTGIIYIAIIIISLYASHQWFVGLFLVLGIITLSEYLKLFSVKNILPYLFMIILTYYFGFKGMNLGMVYTFLVFTIVANCILLVNLFRPELIQKKSGPLFFSLFYMIGGFIFLTLIPFTEGLFEPKIVIGVFLLVWSNDTFAYLVGKQIGKRKLFKSVSPNKTVEGFVAGLICAMVISLIIYEFTGLFNLAIWMIMSLLASVLGTFGDLIQSKFKRLAGVKDSGILMPGHGGFYDRLDSIIFVSPFAFALLEIVKYVS